MKFAVLAIAATLGFAPTTLATVAYGVNLIYGTHAAWIDGNDPCNSIQNINSESSNPCGILFKLSNGYSYKLENCGDSDFALYNSDGSYNHKCTYSTKSFYCTAGIIQRQWLC